MPFAALPHGHVHYQLDGDPGAPWLVLCHALGNDLTLWQPQVRALGQRFRLLRYDQRGHGESACPPGEYSMAELGTDVVRLLDALEIERAHVCGLSIGGMVAMSVAARAPERVERLVLANTAARIGTRQVWADRIAQVQQAGLAPLVELALERWFSPAFRAREPATVENFRQRTLRTDARGYAACCAALRDADLHAELTNIRAPSLVISGSEDPVTTTALARELVEELGGARLVELRAGHLSNVEAASDFSQAVLEFLS